MTPPAASTTVAGTAALADLTREERLLLWGMRVWVAGAHRCAPVLGIIETAFATVMADAVIPLLDVTLFQIMTARPLAFHSPECPAIGDDERTLLDVLALHQHGEGTAALFLTRRLLPAAAARLVGGDLRGLANGLLACGIALPDRRARELAAAVARPASAWAPSSRAVH
ncbi:MAG TPA: hypothetical protein VED21_00715 [Azospirillum sp.]|nr:hypothetical protein [Azospirillum sp.]